MGNTLHDAIRRGDFEEVKKCVEKGAEVNSEGFSPLSSACALEHDDIIVYLIERGAKARGGVNEQIALSQACSNGNLKVTKSLISAGVDVNKLAQKFNFPFSFIRNEVPRLAIIAACSNNHVEIVKVLIDAGADVNKADETGKKTALIAACEKNSVESVELLVNARADVNKFSGKALRAACMNNFVKIVSLLIDAGANVNEAEASEKTTALIAACENNSVESVELLINAGADVNKIGYEALPAALYHGQYWVALLLLNSGVELKDTGDSSVLHIVANELRTPAVTSGRENLSPAALEFVKVVIARAPHLMELQDAFDRRPHEVPCHQELSDLLVRSWVQYHYREVYSHGRTKPNAIKVFVIGDARAGKTTLIRSLQTIEWREKGDNERTAGIVITAANVESAGDLVLCDFAGQPLFHKTHGLFFSESSTIFLLVADLTKTEEELKAMSNYWASFVKCSVRLSKAYVVVIGSRKDKLTCEALKTAEKTMQNLIQHLQTTFGEWFKIYDKFFVLNCRKGRSGEFTLLRKELGEIKKSALKAASDVPTIVQTAQKDFLPILRDPSLIKQFPSTPADFWTFLSYFKKILRWDGEKRFAKEVRRNTFSLMKSNSLIPTEGKFPSICCLDANVFKKLMVESVCPGLAENVQTLLVGFLQAIGEILVIDNQVILDPCWFSNNVIGPLLSPESDGFRFHLNCPVTGTASKKSIQKTLENFNKQEWINVDETINLLCDLEICYPFLGQPDTYQFPAHIREERPGHVWSINPQMKIYAGRRLRCKEKTDMITPGTMPFIQSHVRNVPRLSEPEVWQGGLLIKRSTKGLSVEGMILLQDREKAIDFIVRGPEHFESECKTLLEHLMAAGKTVLRRRSPGTKYSLWYISSSELKELKLDACAYKSETVDTTTSDSAEKSIKALVYQEGIEDSLKDLLALPDDHFTFLQYDIRCSIGECLKKDSDGREALAKVLLPKSGDRLRCDSAEKLLAIWSTYLEATTKRFADAARVSGLLYLLSILNDCGAINLCEEEEKAAREDLIFFEANSSSAIATRRLSAATESLAASPPAQDCAAAAIRSQAPRSSEVWAGDDYLDASPNSGERCKVAERIQSVWNHIGRILGPEPFKHYQLHAFGEKRADFDRALAMLDAWASEFGRSATRRQLIKAMKRVGCLADAEEVFSGQY